MQASYSQLGKHIAQEPVVFVDLDGTLVKEELTTNLAVAKMKRNPLLALTYCLQALINKPKLKTKLARQINHWTYRENLLCLKHSSSI